MSTVANYKSPVYTVTTDTSVIDTLKLMLEKDSRIIVIVGTDNKLVSVVTGSDIIRELDRTTTSTKLLRGHVEHVMSKRPMFTIQETALMVEAIEVMNRHQVHDMIVCKETVPTGILRQLDIIRWWMETFPNPPKA